MHMKYIALLFILIAAGVSIGQTAPASPAPSASEGGVQVIEVTAKKYEFDPSPIRVKRGTKVQLKVTATDHAHGMEFKLYPENVANAGTPGLEFSSPQKCYKVEKGQTETIEFVAQTPGTYAFKCCTECGFHHRSMKGELIVEP